MAVKALRVMATGRVVFSSPPVRPLLCCCSDILTLFGRARWMEKYNRQINTKSTINECKEIDKTEQQKKDRFSTTLIHLNYKEARISSGVLTTTWNAPEEGHRLSKWCTAVEALTQGRDISNARRQTVVMLKINWRGRGTYPVCGWLGSCIQLPTRNRMFVICSHSSFQRCTG